MTRSILEAGVLEEVCARIGAIEPDTQPRWGTLDAARLMGHLRGALQLAQNAPDGERPRSSVKSRLMAWAFIGPVPFPKGIKLAKKYAHLLPQVERDTFDLERESLLGDLRSLVSDGPQALCGLHPVFGPLSGEQWGRLVYKHSCHHFKQFGV